MFFHSHGKLMRLCQWFRGNPTSLPGTRANGSGSRRSDTAATAAHFRLEAALLEAGARPLYMIHIEEKKDARQHSTSMSPSTEHFWKTLAGVAESDCPVLIVGEHGVGKRTTAMEIHARSRRSHERFADFLCKDLDASRLQSILQFKGTAYMAEAGSLSTDLQELLIEAYFLSAEARSCRLLFGSSRELMEDVRAAHMREDFYYLVSAVTLRLSPLRFRKPEILTIADTLLGRYSKQFDRPKPALSEEIVQFLMDHTWPDNLPELQTAIKTFVVIGDQAISLAALKAATPPLRMNGHRGNLSLKEATRQASLEVERQLISQVLGSTGGNRKRAATELGISYKALLYKIKQIGLTDLTANHRFGVAL